MFLKLIMEICRYCSIAHPPVEKSGMVGRKEEHPSMPINSKNFKAAVILLAAAMAVSPTASASNNGTTSSRRRRRLLTRPLTGT